MTFSRDISRASVPFLSQAREQSRTRLEGGNFKSPVRAAGLEATVACTSVVAVVGVMVVLSALALASS
jgi:hypothetical protein